LSRCAVTIASVEWATVAVALVVALIGAGAGFAGGYFGARWQAGTNLAQWRRDRLLQFCADLLAAGLELTDIGRGLLVGESYPPNKMEATKRLEHAVSCVWLLSGELAEPARDYHHAVINLVKRKGRKLDDPELVAEATQRGRFIGTARFWLLDLAPSPTPWSHAWAFVKKALAPPP